MPSFIPTNEAISRIKQSMVEDEATKDKASDQENVALKSANQEVKTRHTLTRYFLVGFFGLIVICFIFVPIYNSHAVHWMKELHSQGLDEQAKNVKFLDIEKVLAIIIGALGSSLGFIIGYYYKEKGK